MCVIWSCDKLASSGSLRLAHTRAQSRQERPEVVTPLSGTVGKRCEADGTTREGGNLSLYLKRMTAVFDEENDVIGLSPPD